MHPLGERGVVAHVVEREVGDLGRLKESGTARCQIVIWLLLCFNPLVFFLLSLAWFIFVEFVFVHGRCFDPQAPPHVHVFNREGDPWLGFPATLRLCSAYGSPSTTPTR